MSDESRKIDFSAAIEEIERHDRLRQEWENRLASTSVSGLVEETLLRAFGIDKGDFGSLKISVSKDTDGWIEVDVHFVAPREYKTL